MGEVSKFQDLQVAGSPLHSLPKAQPSASSLQRAYNDKKVNSEHFAKHVRCPSTPRWRAFHSIYGDMATWEKPLAPLNWWIVVNTARKQSPLLCCIGFHWIRRRCCVPLAVQGLDSLVMICSLISSSPPAISLPPIYTAADDWRTVEGVKRGVAEKRHGKKYKTEGQILTILT